MKLTKRQLSINLHVDDTTIYLWERNKGSPSLAQIPKIIEFLGRDPFEKRVESLGENIREYRRIHGLTQKRLAEQLGVDETTLASWENGEHHPSKKLLEKISDTIPLLDLGKVKIQGRTNDSLVIIMIAIVDKQLKSSFHTAESELVGLKNLVSPTNGATPVTKSELGGNNQDKALSKVNGSSSFPTFWFSMPCGPSRRPL